jgi:diguanylate cyclase (GGDEF)-like protein
MGRQTLLYVASALAVPLIGFLDYLTGPEISFSIFYVAPIGLVAMKGRRSVALALAVTSALVWLAVEGSTHAYAYPAIAYWNGLARLGFFGIVAVALARIQEQTKLTADLAATDALTGLANSRTFYEVLEREVERMSRSGNPLTLAYLDLDNFKAINDRKGHSAGDELLRRCAQTLRSNVRVNDTVARLGGDEFAIIFPETRREVAEPLLARMRRAAAKAVESQGWDVTLSVGAVTTDSRPDAVQDLVRAADALMYRVKTQGKNGLLVAVMEEDEESPPPPLDAA